MALIQSNSCLFQVMLDGTYKTVMCLRNFSVSPVTETKEITGPTDGKFKDYDYKQLSYTVSIDGVMFGEDPANPVLFDFATYQLGFLQIPFRVIYVDEANQKKVFRGQGLVENCNIETSAGAIAAGTVQLLGKGEYFLEDGLPEYVNLRIHMHGNTGDAFLKFQLIDDEGEAVFQTDILPQASGGDLANPIDITVPALKGTWYYWFQVVSNIIGNVFTLDAPPTKTTNFNNGTFSETSFPTQAYDFTTDRTIAIEFGVNNPPPTCVPPTIQQGIVSPNGTVGTYYSRTVVLGGVAPFVVSNVVKPSWMNVSISGNVITCEGNPSLGLSQNLSFDVSNACGSTSYSTTINISAGIFNVIIDYNYSEVNLSSVFQLYRNGVIVVQENSSGSGTLIVNSVDTVEARIIGAILVLKHLKVEDDLGNVLYDSASSSNTIGFSWNAVIPRTYTVTAIS